MTKHGPNRPPFSKKAARGLRDVVALVVADLQVDASVGDLTRTYPADHPVHAAVEYLAKLDQWIRARQAPRGTRSTVTCADEHQARQGAMPAPGCAATGPTNVSGVPRRLDARMAKDS